MKFRKRPVVVEAYQTDKEMIIHTLEGDMRANVGDWIITGLRGEWFTRRYSSFIYATYPIISVVA